MLLLSRATCTASARLKVQLEPGERLLWSGQPKQGLALRSTDWFMVPFSLLWGGFAIFWELEALDPFVTSPNPVNLVMALFGIPFVLVGLYMMFGRFFADSRARAKTYYGVTDQRAIIVSGLFSRQVTSLPYRSMPQVTINVRPDRSGTITFGQPNSLALMSEGTPWPGADLANGPLLQPDRECERCVSPDPRCPGHASASKGSERVG